METLSDHEATPKEELLLVKPTEEIKNEISAFAPPLSDSD